MIGYSIATLKWGLSHCYDRDIAAGIEPFSQVSVVYWSMTSGHTEETIEALRDEIKRDRETRVEPAVDPILPCEGK